MKMSKIFILTLLIFSPSFSFAQIMINEVMYDVSGSDTGREWVEIYNSGGNLIDISSFKFLESSGASNHSLTLIQGTASIPSGGLAVIVSDSAKFLIDWPSFSGNLFKASFSMNNTGSTLLLKDGDLNVQNEVNYSSEQGGNGDGNTLQKSGSSWVSGTPTPGVQNNTVSNTSNSTSTSNVQSNSETSSSSTSSSGSNSAHSSPAPLSDTNPKVVFEVSAGRDRLTTVGNNINFQGTITKSDGISENSIFYNWSFGDGFTTQGKIVSHAYKFPGDYVVVLNAESSDLQAVSRVNVKVISPQITISKVSGGIEVNNKTSSEINIEGWSLLVDKKSFIFPKDTLIGPNKRIVFADSLTNLVGEKGEMLSPLGQMFASFDDSKSLRQEIVLDSTTNKDDIALIQVKLEEARKELARMTAAPEKSSFVQKVIEPAGIEVASVVDLNQEANVIEVFKAERSTGTVSRMFAWPMRGVGWVRRLFVEE